MLEKIKTSRLHVGNFKFVVGSGVEVCSKCVCSVMNIGQNAYSEMMKRFKRGEQAAGFVQGCPQGKTTELAIAWLARYAEARGDHRPDKRQILLSYDTRKNSVYNEYINEVTEEMEVPIG